MRATSTSRTVMSEAITPFKIAIDQTQLDDLKRRLARHALARQGNARRLVARHSARVREGTVQLLGEGLRLARARKTAEPLPAVPHHDRRRRHSLHPRALAARERVAAGDDARLARLDRRVPEGHRTADRSDETRRQGRRCIPRRVSVAARLRLLRQADHAPAGTSRRSAARGAC